MHLRLDPRHLKRTTKIREKIKRRKRPFQSFIRVDLRKLAAVRDGDHGFGLSRAAAVGINLLHNIHAFGDLSKNTVLAVEP